LSNFHSISFPSEWGPVEAKIATLRTKGKLISIQLVSPASGDVESLPEKASEIENFHSISFPSEWGPSVRDDTPYPCIRFPFN